MTISNVKSGFEPRPTSRYQLGDKDIEASSQMPPVNPAKFTVSVLEICVTKKP